MRRVAPPPTPYLTKGAENVIISQPALGSTHGLFAPSTAAPSSTSQPALAISVNPSIIDFHFGSFVVVINNTSILKLNFKAKTKSSQRSSLFPSLDCFPDNRQAPSPDHSLEDQGLLLVLRSHGRCKSMHRWPVHLDRKDPAWRPQSLLIGGQTNFCQKAQRICETPSPDAHSNRVARCRPNGRIVQTNTHSNDASRCHEHAKKVGVQLLPPLLATTSLPT